MKSISESFHLCFKCLFFFGLVLLSLNASAQKNSVILDPKLGRIAVTDIAGSQVNENYIQQQQVIRLKFRVDAVTHGKAIPAGSCKIKIGLGSKLLLEPSFDLNTVELANYFKWTLTANGGQQQLTGELVAELPANFREVDVAFKAIGNTEGSSTITANFLITNHRTNTILSDEDGANNMAFLHYRVTKTSAPTPLTSIVDVKKSGCTVNVSFTTNKEINLERYEVEVSKDGTNFVKTEEIRAMDLPVYNTGVVITTAIQSRVLYVRIKSLFADGKITYSDSKTADGTCDGNWKLDIFPNPASNLKSVVIRAVEGVFKGKYLVVMFDMNGKVIRSQEITLDNVTNFKYDVGFNIAAGKYLVKVVNQDGLQTALLKFERL